MLHKVLGSFPSLLLNVNLGSKDKRSVFYLNPSSLTVTNVKCLSGISDITSLNRSSPNCPQDKTQTCFYFYLSIFTRLPNPSSKVLLNPHLLMELPLDSGQLSWNEVTPSQPYERKPIHLCQTLVLLAAWRVRLSHRPVWPQNQGNRRQTYWGAPGTMFSFLIKGK